MPVPREGSAIPDRDRRGARARWAEPFETVPRAERPAGRVSRTRVRSEAIDTGAVGGVSAGSRGRRTDGPAPGEPASLAEAAGEAGGIVQVEPAVSRVLSRVIIHLDAVSPRRSSDQPGDDADHAMVPLFGLAPGGVCRAVECCHRRGALLPHPFTLAGDTANGSSRSRLGGLLSAALSVGSRPPGVTWRPVLRSPDFPRPRRALTRPASPR